MTPVFEFDLLLALDVRSPAAARHVIDGLADGMPAEVVERFRIVASELVTNALRHGTVSDRVRMVGSVDRDGVRLQVLAWDPRLATLEARPDEAGLSRWGLFLIDRMADRWGVTRNGEPMVWCEFDTEPVAGGRVEQPTR
jgi:anti-sigma regulatory factor (Ser/Thr protein kinase)